MRVRLGLRNRIAEQQSTSQRSNAFLTMFRATVWKAGRNLTAERHQCMHACNAALHSDYTGLSGLHGSANNAPFRAAQEHLLACLQLEGFPKCRHETSLADLKLDAACSSRLAAVWHVKLGPGRHNIACNRKAASIQRVIKACSLAKSQTLYLGLDFGTSGARAICIDGMFIYLYCQFDIG